jgi:hypothetical protein
MLLDCELIAGMPVRLQQDIVPRLALTLLCGSEPVNILLKEREYGNRANLTGRQRI